MKIHFITYGNEKYIQSKERIKQEAIQSNFFDTITIYGPDDLDSNFKETYKNILNLPRIAGYGIWRPYLIKKILEIIEYDDILIYLDAGCTINNYGKNRFDEYIKMLNQSELGIISFQMSIHKEKIWTTKEIFKYFNLDMDGEIANSGQINDGILIMKKNEHLITIINIWYDVIYDNVLLFTDYYNHIQVAYFKDNRHEQSIFSIIRKIYGSIVIEDETYFEPFGTQKALKYPFWATRIRC